MKREQLNKWWKEVQALADGKQIQFLRKDNLSWEDIDDPNFQKDIEYRVKPEPLLIPFDYSDAEFLLGKSVKSVDGTLIGMVTSAGKCTGVRVGGSVIYDYADFLKTFTFFDGTPCGKQKKK